MNTDQQNYTKLTELRFADESLCFKRSHHATDCPPDCPDYNMRDVFIYSAQNAQEMNGDSAHRLQELYLSGRMNATPIGGDQTATYATN